MQQNAKKEKIYIFLVALFSSVVILSNLLIAKWVWIPFYPRGVPGGLLLYPLTFLISDLVLELYGKQSARFMVLVGFFMAVFSWVILGLLHVWPEGHNSSINLGFFFQFFGAGIFSSLVAYLVGQFCDMRIYDWIGNKTGARYLWLRSGGSSLISQSLDTLIVNALMFIVFIPQGLSTVFTLMLASYLYKAIVAVLMIPIFYLVVNSLKKSLKSHGVYQT